MTTGADTVRQDVAVVLCTFNGAEHIVSQVASILGQTVLPSEIRVYDDGSTDDTLGLVRETWQRRSARALGVRLHVAPPAPRAFGAAQNFARAIADVPQPIVALSDQDDVWQSDRLAATLHVLDADPHAEVVASNATMVDAEGHEVGRTVFEAQRLTRSEWSDLRRGITLPALLRRNLVPGMTFTFRRALADSLGPLPAGAMHDYWLAAAAAARGTLRIVPRSLVRYRIHGANAVGLDTGNRSLIERVRVKLGAFRSPLTDLPQWAQLPSRLEAMGDDAAAERLRDKLDFEIGRRHEDESALTRIRSAWTLLRGEGYRLYDFQGRATGFRDLVRRTDPMLKVTAQNRSQ